MELNTFIENVADQFEETDPGMIQADTVFKELEEWDSLIALSIIAMIDEVYNKEIKGNDIRTATTIEDLFNIVKSK